jgi:tetratricopeptide (TPR) repeat protein/tRNA A-37 threonylcarbamoyl transferase component Bud32
MTSDTSSDRELLYSEVTDAIMAELRSGRQPDLALLANRYPSLAGELAMHVGQLASILRAESALDQLPRRLGDFWLLRELGRGGMGVVYEADQLSRQQRVAVKVLPAGAIGRTLRLQRFRHEIQAAAQLHHPHIVPVLAVSAEGESSYYAMPFIDGPSIAELMRQQRLSGSMTRDGARFRAAAKWGQQAAEALHYAHEMGVVHRDVKPANLLLDSRGDIWVTDFGLARMRGEVELTATGDTVGTLRYMSPEQAKGARGVADHRVDVYGLGVTLYEFLTLEPAVPGEERGELLRRLLYEEPRPPRCIDPTIPHDLETIVLKAMRHDSSERYATAAELAADLGRYLAGQPIQARRPTRRQRAQAWIRRHTFGVAAALGILLFVCGVLSVSTALTVRAYGEAKRKQNDAEQQRVYAEKQKNYAEKQTKFAEKQREYAEERKEYAERSRAVARRAVDQVLTGVVKDWLEGNAKLEPVQKQLLEQLLTCCQELSDEDATDTEAKMRVAEALHYAGAIAFRLGRHDQGRRTNEQALAVLAELDHDVALDSTRQFLRAKCLDRVALAQYAVGNYDQAEHSLREAIALVESLLAKSPNEPIYRRQCAVMLLNFGYVLRNARRDRDEANRSYDRAIQFLTSLLEEKPANPHLSFLLASARSDQAGMFLEIGRLAEAKSAAQNAVSACRKLLIDFPNDADGLDRLAITLVAQASILMRGGQFSEAVLSAQEGASVSARLAADNPRYPPYREQQVVALGVLADACMRTGQIAEAERASTTAVEIIRPLVKEHSDVVKLRTLLAESLLRVGWCAFRTGRRANAESAYREGIELLFQLLHDGRSHDDVCRQHLAKALPSLRLVQGGNEQFALTAEFQQQVMGNLRKLAGLEPEDRAWRIAMSETLGFLGAVNLRMGRPNEAEQYYRQQLEFLKQFAHPIAVGQSPATTNLAWFLADCPLKSLRDPQQALKLAQQSWDATTTKTPAHRLVLACANNALARYDEAAKLLEPLVNSAPASSIDLWRHWAIAQYHLGHKDEAREALHKIVQVLRASGQVVIEHQLLLREANEILGNPEPTLSALPASVAKNLSQNK